MLKTDPVLALAYQKSLVFASLEDFAVVDVMGNVCGGQFGATPSAWQKSAADFIYINLKTRLIQMKDGYEVVEPNVTPEKLHQLLLTTTPEVETLLWMGIQFTATNVLLTLIKSAGLHGWDSIESNLNQQLITSVDSWYSSQIK